MRDKQHHGLTAAVAAVDHMACTAETQGPAGPAKHPASATESSSSGAAPVPAKPLEGHRPALAALCVRYGVSTLALFGSAARGEFVPGRSDYDFLVELDADAPGSRAQRLLDFADALEALLGARVDLVNPRYIRNPYFAAEVARTQVAIYG